MRLASLDSPEWYVPEYQPQEDNGLAVLAVYLVQR
jgi:hypothetical protein